MKKPAVLKFILVALIFFQGLISYSQILQGFKKECDEHVRGDILLIGNNILNRNDKWYKFFGWHKRPNGDEPNVPYNGNGDNGSLYMEYIDIDNDSDTFNSSSADLDLPDPTCSKIIYAGLYWSATQNGSNSVNEVKLKTPGGGYININGSAIYSKPGSYYASYANVTSHITGLSTPGGTYTVANVSTAQQGNNHSTDLSAGWSLFIVYENAKYTEKAITSFNGFNAIGSIAGLNIPVSGFTTVPNGQVNAEFAFSALEGDRSVTGDYLQINGSTVNIPDRPEDNFFNSTITSFGSILGNRNPNSSNTLGFDAGVFQLPNPGNSVIRNGDTSATIHLGTTDDLYLYYFNAFAVEIIAPRIVTVEKIKAVDAGGNTYDANGQVIEMNKEIRYEITFENKGNDDAENFTITDVLPANVVYNNVALPSGVTFSYVPATREIVFNIPDYLVRKNSSVQTIRIFTKTTNNCDLLIDACSNKVENTATSSYRGNVNTATLGSGTLAADEGCSVGVPAPVSFYIDRSTCEFKKTVFSCDNGIILKAGDNFSSYVWRDSGGNVVGYNQQFTATKADTYTVSTSSSCPPGTTQTFYVKDRDNPLNSFADNIDLSTHLPYKCISDAKPFPKIFLCSKDAQKDITLNLPGATNISWQENKGVLPSSLDDDCPNKSVASWEDIASGLTYSAKEAGAYRIVVTYGDGSASGSSCTNTYYFNVIKNVIEPAFTTQNVVCDTKGSITITKPMPTDRNGYEYSLDGVQPYQASNVFNNIAVGTYSVHIRPKVTDTRFENCEYVAKVTMIVDPTSLNANLTLTTPLTDCNVGEITVSATNGVEPYSYYVGDSTTPQSLPTIPAKTAKEYKVKVSDFNNCETTATITVSKIPRPTTTAIELD